MKKERRNLSLIMKEHSARRRLAVAVCLVALATVFAVFWALRISGLTLADGDLGSATVTDASADEDATATDGTATFTSYGISLASDDGDSGTANVSDDDSSTDTTGSTTSTTDTSEYYLATTVDAGSLTSGSEYIIYTVINGTYYVLTSDETLTACTTVSSVSEATGDGPYYVASTGTIIYAASGTAYSGSVWTMTQSGSGSSCYYAENTSTSKYLAASGSGSSSDVTLTTGFSSENHTGELTFYGDFELTYTFHNSSNKDDSGSGNNWYNFVVEMASSGGVYLDVRADNFGWLAGQSDENDSLTFGDGSSDWSTWLAAMQDGADVTVVITRTGADIIVKTTAANETFTANAWVSEYANDAALTVYLTGQYCTISDVEYTATVDTVNLTSDSAVLTCGSTGATLAGTPLAVVASVADGSSTLAWASTSNSDGTVFYFAEVQDTADNYHFAETVTLTDAAENQDDSYVVYTKIGDTYYIVSAVDGSLLACTDISSCTSDDDKVLLSATVGVYIWDYDETTKEPEFKFTTGSDDDGTDEFEDYRWFVSSSDYDSTSGTGTYTLSNEENEDYLAPELDADTNILVRTVDGVSSNKSSTGQTLSSGYGTFEYTVTIDGAYSSSGTNYVYFRVYICNTYNTAGRYIRLTTPNVAVGTDWADVADSGWDYGSNYTVSGYGMGSMTLNVGDTLTITVITSDDCMYVNFYNEDTQQTYVRVINYSGGYSFGTYGTTSYIQNIYGDLTVTAVTYGANSSYGSSASISSGEGTTLDDGSLSFIDDSEMTLSGDFDITYAFTNKSNSATLDSDADSDTIAAAAADNFAIRLTDGTNSIYVRATNSGYVTTTSGGTETTSSSTFYTYGSPSSDSDWSTFAAAMQSGASCEVRVVRTGNNFTFIMTVTPTDTTNYSDSYTLTASVVVSDFEDGGTVYAYLGGENCTISSATCTNNTARERNNTEYHRVSDVTEKIEITSTSESSYYEWTASATGYYSEAFTLIGQLATDTANTAEIEWVENTTAGSDATGTATTTLAKESAAALSDTVALTFSLARVSTYFVWFDGTNGGMSSYSANTSATAYDKVMEIPCDAYGNLTSITTPGNITDASGYGIHSSDYGYYYTLRGWYDIYNGKYYEPGEEVTLTASTVMYADWEVNTYNIAQVRSGDTIASTVSTNSFITTHLFDYNELFNAQSAVLTDSVSRTESRSGNGYTMTEYRTLTLSGHRELFILSSSSSIALGDSTSLGFIFFRSETYPFTYSELTYTVSGNNPLIDYPDDRGSITIERNTVNGSGNSATQGILGSYGTYATSTAANELSTTFTTSTATLLSTLFGTGNTVADVDDPSEDSFVLGKTYVGTADYLFQYDSATGYYYYNSGLNAASYYADDARFYVYDYTVKADVDGSTDDFLPFNYGTDSEAISAYNINYWFGMSSEIEFYLPDDVPDGSSDNNYGEANLAIDNSHHMTFKFSGDDDVWVFIDGQLVLDLGGVHGEVYGEIDFSTGEVMVVNTVNSSTVELVYWNDSTVGVIDYTSTATAVEQTEAETYVQALKAGTHTLTFYYLERGASQSNSAIYLNISSTTYNLNLSKVDEENETTSLDGAEFTFYTDEDEDGEREEAEGLTDQSGNEKITFSSSETVYGLEEGTLYYVVETTAPDGYSAEGKYFTIQLNGSVLTVTVYETGSDDPVELYTYTITYASDGNCTYTLTYADGSSTQMESNWYYVLGSSATFSASLSSSGSVEYYTIGLTIANAAGYVIPSTGGIGTRTYLFTGEAIVLIAGAGLMMMAFYNLVWLRRYRTGGNKEELTDKEKFTEDKRMSSRRFAGTRGHPRQRGDPQGRARDRPGDR